MSRVLQFTVIWGADVVSFGTQKVSFGMPVGSNPGALGSTSWVDFGTAFGKLLANFGATYVYFMLVSRSLF